MRTAAAAAGGFNFPSAAKFGLKFTLSKSSTHFQPQVTTTSKFEIISKANLLGFFCKVTLFNVLYVITTNPVATLKTVYLVESPW